MRLVCLSDTHGFHDKIPTKIPDGDFLIISGDITNSGSFIDLQRFAYWLEKFPKHKKVVIAGNHDWCFSNNYGLSKKFLEEIPDTYYLQEDFRIIDGVSFYGSPWAPEFGTWAFMADQVTLRQKWSLIPTNLDVLITHGPPYVRLDRTEEGVYAGCTELLNQVIEKSPKVHVFGHIHEGYGKIKNDSTWFVNASTCTRQYKPTNPPIIIDL